MGAIRVRGLQLWHTLPACIENSTSLKDFKTKIRDWNPSDCQCCLDFKLKVTHSPQTVFRTVLSQHLFSTLWQGR